MTFTYVQWDENLNPKLWANRLEVLEISIRRGGFRQPLLQAAEQVLAPGITYQFQVGGDPAWSELKESTKERKERGGWPDRKLVRTGKLERAASVKSRWHISNDTAQFNLDGMPATVQYGMYHLTGTKHMEPRPWLRFRDDTIDRVAPIFDEWLSAKIGEIL